MLKTRVLTVLALLPLLLAAIWWLPAAAFWWLVACLAAVGGKEWCRLAGIASPVAGWGIAAVLLLAVGLGLSQVALRWLDWIGLLAAVLWLGNALWLARSRALAADSTLAAGVKLAIGLAVLLMGSAALGGLFAAEQGRFRLLLFLLIIWAADIGAYAAGRAFGRRKLAPTISPGKTWEGVVGGQLLVAALVAGLAVFDYPLSRPAAPLIALAAVCAAVSVVGDLFVSLLKRHRGIKDSGHIFPGHGGVLDRFDSALAAAPIFAWGLTIIR